MRRGPVVAMVTGAVVASAGLGWAAATQIRSPAAVAANAEAPEPSNITVAVVRETLSADVVTRGDIVYDEPVQLSLSGSFAGSPEALVVTQAAEVDAELQEGDVAVEVTGRPVFLLEGEIPMYRDLRPGAEGEDVLQVEQALGRLGHLEPAPDEVWDAATGAAVASWYEEAGYVPNGVSDEDSQALAAARDRVRAAQTQVADTEAAAAEARKGPGLSAVRQAEAEVRAAEDALQLARMDAERAQQVAVAGVEDATDALDGARDQLARAEQRLAQAREGTHPDTGEPPTSAQMRELEDEVAAAQAAVDEATDAVDAANYEVERTRTEQASLVRQAEDRLAVARAALDETRSSGDASGLASQLDAARQELATAREDLADMESRLGTWLPAGEIVFLNSLPVRVDSVAAARGSTIEGTFATVSGSELALRASVRERDAVNLEEGAAVIIEHPEGGPSIDGTITTVADRTGTHDVGSDRIYVEIAPAELPSELIGQNVKVTIPVNSTGGEVLAVPAAALSATADGSTRVEVEGADGELRSVKVEPGLSAGGLVEITPVDESLTEGDLVVVGRDTEE